MKAGLTHLDASGVARMVDVSAKQKSDRTALARAVVRMSPECARQLADGQLAKGDAVAVARVAGIQAAKRTGTLIPLAHPLPLDHVDVDVEVDAECGLVAILARASVCARTGVEMEAMTAAALAGLAIYDMVKSVDRDASVERIELLEKAGGRSGTWRRNTPETPS